MAEDEQGKDLSDPRSWLLPDDDDAQEPPSRGLFDDGPATESIHVLDDDGAPPLRLGPDDTGPLPHWTAPPTGEVPSILGASSADDECSLISEMSLVSSESSDLSLPSASHLTPVEPPLANSRPAISSRMRPACSSISCANTFSKNAARSAGPARIARWCM